MRNGGHRRFESDPDANAMRAFESFVSSRSRHGRGGRHGFGEHHGEGMSRFGDLGPFMSFGGTPHRGNIHVGPQSPPPPFPPMFGLRNMPGFGGGRGSAHGRHGFGGHGRHGLGEHGKHGFGGHGKYGFGGRGGHHMHHLGGRGGIPGFGHKGGFGGFGGMGFEGQMGRHCLKHGIKGRDGGGGGRGMGRGGRMAHGGRSVSEPTFSTTNFAVADE